MIGDNPNGPGPDPDAAAHRAELAEARANLLGLSEFPDDYQPTIIRHAQHAADIAGEPMLTAEEVAALVRERDAAIAERDTLAAKVARLQRNPLAALLHRIPATEAPFELVYHPDADPMRDGSGWTCVVDDWHTYGTLDAVIAAACERLGVDLD